MNITETLKELCAAPGVSGSEHSASETALKLLMNYTQEVRTDSFFNVYGSIKNGGNLPVIMLDAHIDQIGMAVTYIDEKGFIKIGRVGGVDMRILPAQTVTIWASLSGKPIKGVVCTLPPHVTDDEKSAVKESEVAIDTGYSKEELEKLCLLGDKITVDGAFAELQNGRISSPSLDNRSSVACILYALELLKNNPCKYNIEVVFSAQEELGCRGATIASYNTNPDYAITVDVSYAAQHGTDDSKVGKLGQGPMIGIAPSLDRKLFDKLKKLSEENNIPYQIEVMPDVTGTNADNISLSRGGVRSMLLSIPERNMHMPVELLQVSDIEETSKLIALFLESDTEVIF